jgi:hypothetical protein
MHVGPSFERTTAPATDTPDPRAARLDRLVRLARASDAAYPAAGDPTAVGGEPARSGPPAASERIPREAVRLTPPFTPFVPGTVPAPANDVVPDRFDVMSRRLCVDGLEVMLVSEEGYPASARVPRYPATP